MTANTYLQVSELDFDDIKTNLKTYLKSQQQFRDFDFEGSAMNVLLDILAFNTHYNAFYLNMLGNEMFLDTAQQRDSVVSRAKELGYLTRSSQGPTANVTVSFTGIANSVAQFTLPKNSKFSTIIDDVTYTFVTTKAHNVVNSSNTFSRSVLIKQGIPLTHRFTVSDASSDRFIIPNPNVDTSSIIVNVQESLSDTTTTEFTLATDINEVTSTSTVYYLEEVADKKYEVVFSKGVLGKTLKNGNIVIIDYLVNAADATNGANTFTVDTITIDPSYTSVSVTTNVAARGGRIQETEESIKFNAPRSYQTQNRAVVKNDFERIVLSENSDIQSVIAFGGEEAEPKVFGKVYIAIKPFGEEIATQNKKNDIKASIASRTSLSIDPIIIDPTYTYIIPTITTHYNKTTTAISEGEIQTAILSEIANYASNNLERFGKRLRYSRFVRALDNVTTGSILNNEAIIKLQSRITPTPNTATKYTINFNNKIRPGTLTSTGFTYSGFDAFIRDDSNGIVDIYRFNDAKQIVNIVASAGTIDYTTGTVIINNFAPSAYIGIELKITVTPDVYDIVPVREQILLMNSNDATVTVVGET